MPGSIATFATDDPQALHTAWYEGLSNAYPHGVLGDALEPTVLRAMSDASADACAPVVEAGPGFVFEDIAPRLADVDGDGRPEVIAVRTAFDAGAQLVVYTAQGDTLVPLAATPHIGRRNRWLAPAAIADLDGDGAVEIAYVDRPHLAKTLRIWRYADGTFREVAAATGVTNHRIGEAFISGGLRRCGDTPEIVLASADWSRLLAVTFDGRGIAARDLGRWSASAAEEALSCAR
ncbi:VCBS repeat-containing protein [Jannaschia sp.]|nr:VCBS repeat-containing protein [Jannaschia sp.]